MNNSPKKNNYPRPFKFKSSMEDFVFGSSWQAESKKKVSTSPPPLQPQKQINYQAKSLFDTYNRNNLQLSMCDPLDLQVLHRNPIAYEQKIVVYGEKRSNPNRKKEEVRKENREVNVESSEAKLNEFLFNYRKQEEEKKTKKKNFLDNIETKLLSLEKEAEELQHQKEKEKYEIQQIIGINKQISTDLKNAELVGQLNTAIYESSPDKKQVPLKRIEDNMGILELNLAIDEQQQYNKNFLQQIQRVTGNRSKSKRKEEVKMGNTGSLSKTLKRQVQPPIPHKKKLATTWKEKK